MAYKDLELAYGGNIYSQNLKYSGHNSFAGCLFSSLQRQKTFSHNREEQGKLSYAASNVIILLSKARNQTCIPRISAQSDFVKAGISPNGKLPETFDCI